MEISERLQMISEMMQKTKSDWVESNPEDTDLAMYLHFWRGDLFVAAVQCPLDRDKALMAARAGAAGFNASCLTLSYESYTATSMISPYTNAQWLHQEMQFVHEAYPDQQVVKSVITTVLHDRDGNFMLVFAPYRIVDGKVIWGEPEMHDEASEDAHGGGSMYDYLRSVMQDPTSSSLLENNALAKVASKILGDNERRLFQFDIATMEALLEQDLAAAVVLAAEEGTPRQKWIDEQMGKERARGLEVAKTLVEQQQDATEPDPG